MSEPSRELFGWDRCNHEGIGLPGCPICDPDPLRVLVRSQLLDNRDLRAELAALRERVEKAERSKEADGYGAACAAAEQLLADAEAERDSLKADVTEMAAINAGQIESFRSQRDRLEAQHAALRQDRDDACIQRDALKAELATRTKSLADLSQHRDLALADAQADLATLKTELSEVDDERLHQWGLAAALRAQVERLQSIIDDSLKETP